MQSGRHRATRHCQECEHHGHAPWPHSPHYCWAADHQRIAYGDVRTSPEWCPLGHIIPGVPFPTFTPGPDPKEPRTHTVYKRIRRNIGAVPSRR